MIISVIGGGPSGMLLSIVVKKYRPNFTVRLFERNERVGKKLLATGNGRCNYTNVSLKKENFHSENENFPMKIIDRFGYEDTIEFLKTLGIYPTVEKNGKVFPLSLQGSSVLDFLRFGMEKFGVEVVLEEKITYLKKNENSFILKGKNSYTSDIVVIATGGMAMPVSGSDGIGYRLGKELGHNVVDFGPTIVQLESDFKRIKELKGVRIDSNAKLYVNDQFIDEKFGDILFTDYGLSGPAILDLSRKSIEGLNNGKKVEIRVNLLGVTKEEIYKIISERVRNLEGIDFDKFFIGIVNKKLINSIKDVLLLQYGHKDTIINDDNFIKNLTNLLSDFKMNISGYKGFGNAQSTTGGIDTKEVNDNLESTIVNGLYFIGEVLDVDGDCGGYNLQWAWSSAYIAALNIISKGR